MIRGTLAIVLGLAITAGIAITILIVAPLYHLCNFFCGGRLFPIIRFFPRLWARSIHDFCIRGLLGARIAIENGPERPIQHDDIVVVIANHPTTMALASVLWYSMRLKFTPLVVAKDELKRNPFIGWPAALLGAFIFIPRNNRIIAKDRIKRYLHTRFGGNAVLVLFPDQRRAWPDRIQADVSRFAKRIPDVETWLQHTLVPRAGGLSALLESLAGNKVVRLFCITNAFNVPDRGVFNAAWLVGATLHLHVEELSIVFTEEDELRVQLTDLWRAMNERIDRWRS